MDWIAIDSQRSDLRAVPTKACFFNTSTNHFCCANVWGPGTTHCSQECQSWGTLDFLLQKQPPYFSNISESEKLRFSIFQTFKNCQVSPKNQWLFDVLKCVCGLWVMYQKNWEFGVFWGPRLGALRTAVISGSSLLQVLIPVQEWSTYT